MDNVRITNTPYDDVFRTLLNDCSFLIIPVINEVFGELFGTGKNRLLPKRALSEPAGRK